VTNAKTNIIYMGTPDFSVPALKRLATQNNFNISLVVTQPDRPKGRGKKLTPSPVKNAALELGLDIFQPENINTVESKEKLNALNPDFFVVAAFGQLLSQDILDIPKIFPINIHASLLPNYRGASPIQAAILNMDKETGITTMVMSRKMDAGDILLKTSTPINEQDTAQDIHDRLGSIGANLIVKTINALLDNQLTPTPQDHKSATYVTMLKKKDGKIQWEDKNRKILAHINAMTPWPGSFSSLNKKHIKIYKAAISDENSNQKPGTIFKCDKAGIHVSTGENSLIILELMGASGKRLQAVDFVRGSRLNPPISFDA
jgi:methionyl-tRNA formyltransferase